MAVHIGVIAEDDSDVETLYELTCKLALEESFKFRKFVGRGCSKLRRKCRPWALNLKAKGCEHLVVVHDLDKREETELRADLKAKIADTGFSSSVVLIPIREIEAWLLCDPPALKKVFGTARLPKIPSNPEKLSDPKAEIRNRVRSAGGSLYVNTVHNPKIAKECRIELVATRCSSFKPYMSFVRSAVGKSNMLQSSHGSSPKSSKRGRRSRR